MQNNYFNLDQSLVHRGETVYPYTHSLPAMPDTLPPDDATRTAPAKKTGFWPCWNGKKWVQVEDHRGKEGYVDGKAHTVAKLGPLPEGWSDTPPEPTLEERKNAFTAAIDTYMNVFAQTRGYYSLGSAASYFDDEDPIFAAEGAYAKKMRSLIYRKGYEILDAVLSGQRPMPTIEEVIAELPPLAWPEVGA